MIHSAITTKIVPATNTKPTRIKARIYGDDIMVPYDHSLGNVENHRAAAYAFYLRLRYNAPTLPIESMLSGQTHEGHAHIFKA